ncbi:MAG TPA: hypothetical protein VMV83_08570 [Rectinemataceae bacterium]|nr:hypothetical protein [Rectinemataceae bacterium]
MKGLREDFVKPRLFSGFDFAQASQKESESRFERQDLFLLEELPGVSREKGERAGDGQVQAGLARHRMVGGKLAIDVGPDTAQPRLPLPAKQARGENHTVGQGE